MNDNSKPKTVRCAIYCRKSSSENIDRDGNSLDIQRECCRDFINVHKHEGWVALERTYEDGGYSGGSMDRPELTCMLDDIKAGHIDRVVVYKFDRLSRSVRDFGNIMQILEHHKVEFAAATQPIDSGTSIGKMMINMLMSFAQFERDLVSERMRDFWRKRIGTRKMRDSDIPYGLRRSDHNPDLLIEHEEELAMMRQIIELFGKNYGRDKVASTLNKAGFRTRKGAKWVPQSLKHVVYTTLRFVRDTPEFKYVHDALVRGTGFYRVCNIDGPRLVKINPAHWGGWRNRVEIEDIEAGVVEQTA